MKKRLLILLILLIGILVASCFENSSGPFAEIVYYNSFELEKDTTGWIGISKEMFVEDSAPNRGKRSLHIWGGCIQPTAYIVLRQNIEAGDYIIDLWGKTGESTNIGGVVLSVGEFDPISRDKIEIAVDKKEWTHFESPNILHCPENSVLRLELNVGGFVGGDMFIDEIKIERIR